MTIMMKQSLLPEFDAMERRFRRLWEGVPFVPAFMPGVMPAADVYETPTEYIVELEVPGYEEKDLSLEILDHTLAITGTLTEVTEEKEKAFRVHERLERAFERTFVLPIEVDSEHLSATVEKGVLKVHAPKTAIAEPRKVAITKA
jgi:Molecular chaperone (small heat shock protein)